MKFNDINPETFGGVKVTSVTDRFVTEKTQQSVTRRGNIIASISVPTVRKITVGMVVKGIDVDAVRAMLDAIGEWLSEAQERPLELDSIQGHYYKAKVTNVEPPSFKGASARFSTEFTCSDYRLYDSETNTPVEGADPPSDCFTFAGKHCLNDMGCMFVLKSRTAIPTVVANKYRVTGRAGSIRYDRSDLNLEEGTITGTLYFVNKSERGSLMTAAEIEERVHEVAAWLVLAGRADFIFDSDITRAYEAEIVETADLKRDSWENGMIDVKFTTQPISKSVDEGSAYNGFIFFRPPVTLDFSEAFPNGMGYTTPLIIKVINHSSKDITKLKIVYKDRFKKEKEFSLKFDEYRFQQYRSIIIDGENMTVKDDEENDLTGSITGGDFPTASDPACTLTIADVDVSNFDVVVRARARWI